MDFVLADTDKASTTATTGLASLLCVATHQCSSLTTTASVLVFLALLLC